VGSKLKFARKLSAQALNIKFNQNFQEVLETKHADGRRLPHYYAFDFAHVQTAHNKGRQYVNS